MNDDRRGFTLIELLIVVVVIGLLASIAIPKFQAVREKAFLSAMKSDLRNLANLQDYYYNSAYTYSTNLAALEFFPSDGVTVTFAEADNKGWSASATHAGFGSAVCAIFHGDAVALSPATVVSSVQCTP